MFRGRRQKVHVTIAPFFPSRRPLDEGDLGGGNDQQKLLTLGGRGRVCYFSARGKGCDLPSGHIPSARLLVKALNPKPLKLNPKP